MVRACGALTLLILPVPIAALVAGERAVTLVYGPAYAGAGLLVFLLSLHLWMLALAFPISRAFFALERALERVHFLREGLEGLRLDVQLAAAGRVLLLQRAHALGHVPVAVHHLNLEPRPRHREHRGRSLRRSGTARARLTATMELFPRSSHMTEQAVTGWKLPPEERERLVVRY